MTSYPNQKHITMDMLPFDGGHLYGMVHHEAFYCAASVLKSSGLKVWMFLCLNRNDHKFYLSTKYISDRINLSVNSVQAAINELIEYGYLEEVSKNHYKFHDTPYKVSLENLEEARNNQ